MNDPEYQEGLARVSGSHASHGAEKSSPPIGFDPARCRVCDGGNWVCENHPDRPWDGTSANSDACGCGAGMPCGACNLDMACAGYPRWRPIASAPRDGTLILIAGGTYFYDAETFPTDRPFKGVSIGQWDGAEWNGGYGSEYDAEYWHKPDRWMRLPIATDAIATEAGTATTENTGVVHDGAGRNDIANTSSATNPVEKDEI